MKKIIASTISCCLILFLLNISIYAEQPTNNVIVLFKGKVDKRIIEKHNVKIIREYKNLPAIAISLPTSEIDDLKHNPNIKTVELDQNISIDSQIQDWGIERTKAPVSWESGYTGKGVKIGVIDTGISNSHEDLVAFDGVSFVNYTTSFDDDNGHGTHVSGIIGAKNNSTGVVGIAPDSILYAIKSLDYNGNGYISNIIAGIDWAITNNLNIINMSISTNIDSPTFHEAVDKAYNNGISIVASAGNTGTSDITLNNVQYPAKYDSVISVASIDSSNKRAIDSATGTKIDISAPGVGIYSTYLNNGYTYMSGTSMASPYVAGNLALLKERTLLLQPFNCAKNYKLIHLI